MPGPETAFRPPQTKEKLKDDFRLPNVTPENEQQLEPYINPNDLDVVVPDDTSMLDPVTGELLHAPDDASGLDPVTGELVTPDESNVPTTTKERELPTAPPIRVVIAGLDKSIDQFAREAALEKLEADKIRKGPLFKHIAKRVWHTLTSQYQMVKATVQAREEILRANNLRHHQGKSDTKWREATAQRMASDFGEQLMRKEIGESYHKIGPEADVDPDSPEGKIRAGITDLQRRYIKGEFGHGASMDKASFEAAQKEMFNEWRTAGISQQLMGEARINANTILAGAEQIVAALDAAEGMDAIDKEVYMESMLSNMEIVVGEAHVGSTVEIQETISERLAEKLRSKKWVSEKRLAGAASLLGNELFVAGALSVLVGTGKKITYFIPGLGAAVVAGFRERRALINQRALAGRREDNDQTFTAGNKRQEAINETLHETRPASEMLEAMGKLYNESGELNIQTPAELKAAIRLQAEIDARLDFHFRSKKAGGARLISFADSENREDVRFDLEQALAKVETDLKKLFENPVAKAMLDITTEDSYQDMAKAELDYAVGAIQGGMDRKDKLFNKFMAIEILKKSGITAVVAAGAGEFLKTVGSVVHELATESIQNGGTPAMTLAAVTEHYTSPDDLGDHAGAPDNLGGGSSAPDNLGNYSNGPTDLGDHATGPDNLGGQSTAPNDLGGGGQEPTPPDNLGGQSTAPDNLGNHTTAPDNLGGHSNPPDNLGGQGAPDNLGEHAGPPDNLGEHLDTHNITISDHVKVNLPNGYNAETSGSHVTVTGPDGKTFGLELNQDGTLPQGALDIMHNNGLNVTESTDIIQGPPTITHEDVTSDEFVKNHPEMQKIKIAGWMDNDTARPNLNELGDQHEVMPDGSIRISIDSMTTGGSYHNGQHIDFHEAARTGHLVATVSAGKGSQAHAFVIHFDQSGHALIDKDSAARVLYDSHGNFHGGFEHVGVEDGQNPDGSTRIISLATVVGKNSGHFQDTISTPTFSEVHTYTVTQTATPSAYTPPVTTVPPFEVPPVFPIPIIPTRFGKGEEKEAAGGGADADAAAPTVPGAPGGAGHRPRPGPRSRPTPGGSSRPGGPKTPPGPGGRRRPTTPGQPIPGNSDGKTGNVGVGGGPATGPIPGPSSFGDQSSGPNTALPNPDQQQQPNPNNFAKTPGETILDQVEAESRDLPEGLEVNLRSLSPLEQKMVIRLAHEVVKLVPFHADAGETEDEWREKLKLALVDTSNIIINSIGRFPPETRSLFNAAAPILERISVGNAKPATVPAP